jgi:hypothetical protein
MSEWLDVIQVWLLVAVLFVVTALFAPVLVALKLLRGQKPADTFIGSVCILCGFIFWGVVLFG